MRARQQCFRALMGRFVTSVTVIAVKTEKSSALAAGDEIHAMTANAVSAVSLDPLLLLACIRNESQTLPALIRSGEFSVNVLAAGQENISRHYGGRPQSPSPARWTWHTDKVPVLADANVSFACSIHSSHLAGDHTVIYGEVFAMVAADRAAPALVYATGRYHDVFLAA